MALLPLCLLNLPARFRSRLPAATLLFSALLATVIAFPIAIATADEPRVSSSAPSKLESQYLSNLRQVTRGFAKAGEGYFSPDARTIIYQAVPYDYPFYQIYTQPLSGGRPHRISTGRGRTTCSFFAPDGQSVIFASSHLDPHLDATEDAARRQQAEDQRTGKRRRYQWDFDPQMEIFRADLDGANLKRLTNSPGYDAECAYSPDGRQIVFCSDRGGNPNIYIMAADGSHVRQLTHAPGYNGGPFFSPDGRWVVFRSDRKRKDFLQIMAIGVDGSHEVALTNNLGVNWGPYWHPTKPYLIWAGADHANPAVRPNFDLWLMRYRVGPDGLHPDGPVTRVTDNPAADILPVFSPDGKRLMWTSNRGPEHTSQLWIADFKLPQ